MARSGSIYLVKVAGYTDPLACFTVKWEAIAWAEGHSVPPYSMMWIERRADGRYISDEDRLQATVIWESDLYSESRKNLQSIALHG